MFNHEYIFKDWVSYTGCAVYPVPMMPKPVSIDNKKLFVDLWDVNTHYGQCRRELLELVIDHLENEIKSRSKMNLLFSKIIASYTYSKSLDNILVLE